MIELMVTVGIIGVLSAIAIPSFQANRESAAKGALNMSVSNISSAFHSCNAVKTFTQCNDLTKMGVSCSACNTAREFSAAPKYCIDADAEIGGKSWQVCMELDASAGTAKKTWNQRVCFLDDGAGTGTANNQLKDGTETDSSPVTQCTNHTECTTALGATHACGASASQGVCTTGGVCT